MENKESLWAKWVNVVSVFYDIWCSNGPLSDVITKRSIYDARIQDDVVIADMVVNDSHDHLLFQCKYALKIRNEMLKKSYRLSNQNKLKDIVIMIANGNIMNIIGMVINKLLLAATIYFIWQERKQRLFRNESRTEEVMGKILLINYEIGRNGSMEIADGLYIGSEQVCKCLSSSDYVRMKMHNLLDDEKV
ncbi:hypothetical protein Tco_1254784 [Tanacetum coccineum]